MPTITLTPNSADGVLSGVSEVTLVPAPSGGVNRRLVRWVSIHNADTKKVELFVYLANGASRRRMFYGNLDPGDTFHLDSNDVIPLDGDRSVVAKLGAAPTTSQPEWVSGWGDQSIT